MHPFFAPSVRASALSRAVSTVLDRLEDRVLFAVLGNLRLDFLGTDGINVDTLLGGAPIPINAGTLNLRRVAADAPGGTGTYPDPLPGELLKTFCLELQQPVGAGVNDYDVVTLDSAPVPGDDGSGPLTAVQIARLKELWGRFHASVDTDIEASAFQLAVWEIGHDDDLNLSAGVFAVASASVGVGAQADAYLDAIDGTGPLADLVALSNPLAQDLLLKRPEPTVPAPLPATLGDFVWHDRDRDGTQEAGEEGIAGVDVDLIDSGGAVIASTKTDANGLYLFTGLAAGSYAVKFAKPAGFTPTTVDAGSDGSDSDASLDVGLTATVTLAAGETNLTLDAGFYRGSAVGGTKFRDLTGNGLTADDTPLAGVAIQLFLDVNNNNRLDKHADGAPVAVTTTGLDGSYLFSDLAAGKYIVKEVVSSGFVRTGPVLYDWQAVGVSAGAVSSGNHFANYQLVCPPKNIDKLFFVINGKKKVSDLKNNVKAGDRVTVNFRTRSAEAFQYSLVSYKAPTNHFGSGHLFKQTIHDSATGTFSAGWHELTVVVPGSHFQVDFVCGPALERFGVQGSNINYTNQKRLISAANGAGSAIASAKASATVNSAVVAKK